MSAEPVARPAGKDLGRAGEAGLGAFRRGSLRYVVSRQARLVKARLVRVRLVAASLGMAGMAS